MKRRVNGVDIAFEVHGVEGPWITFSHSLGCSRRMWSRQINELCRTHRVLAYDLRGHGESGVDTTRGSLDLFATDVFGLMDQLEIGTTGFIGISIGGMIGQTLAIRAPGRIASLVLANTTAFMPPAARQVWSERIETAESEGVAKLAMPSLERWFSATFRLEHPDVIARLADEFAQTSTQGYVACCQAIMTLDTRQELERVDCPTLIVGGSDDVGAPPAALQDLQSLIRGAELAIINGAGHLSNIDRPAQFNAALTTFLDRNVRGATERN